MIDGIVRNESRETGVIEETRNVGGTTSSCGLLEWDQGSKSPSVGRVLYGFSVWDIRRHWGPEFSRDRVSEFSTTRQPPLQTRVELTPETKTLRVSRH